MRDLIFEFQSFILINGALKTADSFLFSQNVPCMYLIEKLVCVIIKKEVNLKTLSY